MSVRRLAQGPVPYNEFRQRVRRFRRSDVLRAVASLAADMQQPSGRVQRYRCRTT